MQSKKYYVRLDTGRSYIHLIFNPSPKDRSDLNNKIRQVFSIYANPEGVFIYLDLETQKMIGIRASRCKGIEMEKFDSHQIEGILCLQDPAAHLSDAMGVGDAW